MNEDIVTKLNDDVVKLKIEETHVIQTLRLNEVKSLLDKISDKRIANEIYREILNKSIYINVSPEKVLYDETLVNDTIARYVSK